MYEVLRFLSEHRRLSRRFFMGLGAAAGAIASSPLLGGAAASSAELEKAIASLEPFFTSPADFRDVSRGKPLPHSIPDDKKREVGLTREMWKLDVISDPDNPAKLGRELTKEAGTALDFAGLLQLAETRAVRFAKVMTCLNIG